MIIQFTGMSGAGKSTLAMAAKQILAISHPRLNIEVIDADEYRKTVCADLGFSRADRQENMRRLAAVAAQFSRQGAIALIAAINPYEEVRTEIKARYDAPLVFIHCSLPELIRRDTKGLYHRALLPDNHPQNIGNLTGVNDPYELPSTPELILHTSEDSLPTCIGQLCAFLTSMYQQKEGRTTSLPLNHKTEDHVTLG